MLELNTITPFSHEPKLERGFTLIELLVTIAIAAILLMVAVPGMTAFKRNAELTSATNSLLAAITTARSEAMKRGMHAMVVPKDGLDWNSGVIVFVDQDRDQKYIAASDVTLLTQPRLPSYFAITANPNDTQNVASGLPYMMFDASGFARTKTSGTAPNAGSKLQIARNDLSGTSLLDQTRLLIVAQTGRVRTCKPVSTTDPKCLLTTAE